MPTESDLVYVQFVQSDLPKMQKVRGMLIGAITVARRSDPMYVANPVGHIAFGADLKGNDAKAVGTWYPRLGQLVGDPKQQIDEPKIASKCSIGRFDLRKVYCSHSMNLSVRAWRIDGVSRRGKFDRHRG